MRRPAPCPLVTDAMDSMCTTGMTLPLRRARNLERMRSRCAASSVQIEVEDADGTRADHVQHVIHKLVLNVLASRLRWSS